MVAPLPVAVETIMATTLKGNPKTFGGVYSNVVWLASRAACERLERMVADHAAFVENHHRVVSADNQTYGGNIVAAGLLMANDFVSAGRAVLERYPETDLLLVPAVGFDSLHRNLSGTPAYKIAEVLQRPVWLVRDDGRFDPLLSFRAVRRSRPEDPGLSKAMEAFTAERSSVPPRRTAGSSPL
jgi:hypothetical protein